MLTQPEPDGDGPEMVRAASECRYRGDGLPLTGYGGNGANGNSNGYHSEEPAEGQQSLSFFGWALGNEREREEEPVGAGR